MQDLPISPAASTANPVAAGGAPAESAADTTTEYFGEVLAREIVTATEKLDPKAKPATASFPIFRSPFRFRLRAATSSL